MGVLLGSSCLTIVTVTSSSSLVGVESIPRLQEVSALFLICGCVLFFLLVVVGRDLIGVREYLGLCGAEI